MKVAVASISKSAKALVDHPTDSSRKGVSPLTAKAKTANISKVDTSKETLSYAESKHIKFYCLNIEVEICKCATFWVVWLAIAAALLYFQIAEGVNSSAAP